MDIRPDNVTLKVTFMQEGSTIEITCDYPPNTSPFEVVAESELLAAAISALKDDKPNTTARIIDGQKKGQPLYPITCSECGEPDVTTFKPKPNKPILCQACYNQQKRGL